MATTGCVVFALVSAVPDDAPALADHSLGHGALANLRLSSRPAPEPPPPRA
jgi:hypothetical protein